MENQQNEKKKGLVFTSSWLDVKMFKNFRSCHDIDDYLTENGVIDLGNTVVDSESEQSFYRFKDPRAAFGFLKRLEKFLLENKGSVLRSPTDSL